MKRNILFISLIFFIGLVFIIRLFYLQVIEESTKNPMQSQAINIEYDYPERGYIYDRNGKILVANQLSYDVMVIPNEVESLDTIEFCNLLKIDKLYFDKKLKRAKKNGVWLPYKFLSQLAKNDYAYLQEKIHKFKGFYIQKRIIRNYPQKIAANIVGYISEVNDYTAKKNDYYQSGELIGAWGVEKEYEEILRGVKGKKYFKKNKLNQITGAYKDGEFDGVAVGGKDLTLTIDSELQAYGEQLMKGKRGGIVAIEPSTGEILALVTAPSYDPNIMVGRRRSKSSVKLFNDTINKPMLDRGLQAMYPPGSPFKVFNGLVALEEGVIDEDFSVVCYHGYRYGKNSRYFMGCHCGTSGRPIKLKTAIAKSCNSYFATIYRKIIDKSGETPEKRMNTWAKHLNSFGLGNYLGYDLPVGRKGQIPTGEFYRKWYDFRWRATTTISNAIGQGEVLTTPIQLANATAAVANRGYFYTPHIVKKIKSQAIDSIFTTRRNTTVDPKHFTVPIEGMHEVFKTGTGSYSQVEGIEICGKTGTSENFTRINGKRIKLKDHSILIAFAPKNNPKIAMAVFIENGGYGSTIAAPITSLMIEKYIKGEVKRTAVEEKMFNLDLYDIYNSQIQKIDTIETREK